MIGWVLIGWVERGFFKRAGRPSLLRGGVEKGC